MQKWKWLVSNAVCVLMPTITFAFDHNLGFEAAEHMIAGEQLKLYFNANDPGQVGYTLHLPNGLALTYSEMLALSGDFYAIPDKPISQGKSIEEQKTRFIAAYRTLAEDPAAISEVPKIHAVLQNEYDTLIAGIKRGEKSEDIYAKMSGDNNRQWNCITGGGCDSTWWLSPGRYLNITENNFDHFGDHAWIAYQAGHAVAIDAAIAAHQTHDLKKLEDAYAMNAFASHFLSDRFASGHMRTPRVELPATVTPGAVGSVLADFMHNEENQSGFHVHNVRGDHWMAFGDQYYLSPQNQENRIILEATLQASVDQIFYAYQQGVMPPEDNVSAMIPQADETGSLARNDIASLFYWDDATHTLFRRTDVANIHDTHWTSDWWGWTTLVLLSDQYGLPIESQRELVAAGYGKEAIRYGLIKDKSLMSYVYHQ